MSIGAKVRELNSDFDVDDLQKLLEEIRQGEGVSPQERQSFCEELESDTP